MKKTISMVISFIMLMVICVPFTLSAAGSTDLYDKYTFEEFIKLSEDEVCAISDEIAEEYKQYKNEVCERYSYYENKGYKQLDVPNTHMEVTEELWTEIETYFNEHGDFDGAAYTVSRFFIPNDWWFIDGVNRYTVLGSGDTIHYVILLDMLYNKFVEDYDVYDMSAKAAIWLVHNPNVLEFGFEDFCMDEPEPEVVYGDINSDGKVSICDIIMLSKYNVQGVILNDFQLKSADCNADGEVNEFDTQALMSFLVDLIDTLPYK